MVTLFTLRLVILQAMLLSQSVLRALTISILKQLSFSKAHSLLYPWYTLVTTIGESSSLELAG